MRKGEKPERARCVQCVRLGKQLFLFKYRRSESENVLIAAVWFPLLVSLCKINKQTEPKNTSTFRDCTRNGKSEETTKNREKKATKTMIFRDENASAADGMEHEIGKRIS